MTERAHIRVTKDGSEPRYELMIDQRKVKELSYLDIIMHVSRALEALRRKEPFELVPGVVLSVIETIGFVMQGASSLRWH